MSNETYDAIRVGDKIRATHKTHGDVIEGRVTEVWKDHRVNGDSLELYSVFLGQGDWNFQILETAKPKLPTEPGLYVLTDAEGEIHWPSPASNRIFTLRNNGKWCEMGLSSDIDQTSALEGLFEPYGWGLRRITAFELEEN